MSSIPSYGIPDPTATAQAVISQLEANAADLAAVQAALQQGIGTAAGDSYQELANLQKTLRSTVSRAVNYGQKQFQPSTQALAQSLAAQAAMIQGTMPSPQSLGSMPGPLQVPPGYPAPGVLPQAPLIPTSTAAPPPATSGAASAGGAGDGGVSIYQSVSHPTCWYATLSPEGLPHTPGDPVVSTAPDVISANALVNQHNSSSGCLGTAAAPTVAPKTPITTVPATPPVAPPTTPVPVSPPPSSQSPLTTEPPPGGGAGAFTCPDLSAIALAPESPGSAAWCAHIAAVHDTIIGIGNAILAGVASLTDESSLADALGQLPFVGTALAGLLGGAGVLARLRCAVTTTVAAVRSLVPCASADYLALITVRTLLRSVEDIEVGTDALAWVVDHVRLPFEEVLRIVDYLIAYTCPVEIPGAPEALEAYLHGTIERSQYECWMLCRGHDPAVWEPVLRSRRDRLTPQEAIEYGFRVGWTKEQMTSRLRELGFLDQQDQSERLAMHFELPGIADQLHFLQRNVFDEEYVKQYRLDEGFLERYWSHFGTQLMAIGVPQETARLHFAAHWINPAPTEMREFVYRLRPDKPGVQNPFSLDDYQRLLVEQDVAPYFRERFRETVYRVPALGYVRDMYRSFILDDAELKSIHQDLGYSETDSERFLRVDRLIRARVRSSEAHGWTPAAISQGYVAGVLAKERVYALMLDQGFQNWEADALMERAEANLKYSIFVRARSRTISSVTQDVQQGLDVGTWTSDAAVNALTQLGFDQSFAEGWVSVQQSRAQTRLVKQTVTRLRSGYLRGELDDQGARAALQSLNLTPEAIDRYMVAWSLALTPKRKSLSKSEILAETCAGHMTTAEALARLLNLGYSEEDSGLFLADAQQCLVKRRQQAELAEQRKASAAASQIQRLKKEASAQAKSLGSQARRLEPVAKLQKWARLGLIDPTYFLTRLRSYGYSNSEIDHYWDEAAAAKGSQAQSGATAALHP